MQSASPGARAHWIAFGVVCLGDLMIVLDSTIVNVALPTIRDNLGFSEAGLVWVVNAYLLTFGGFLLLGGRLADLFGQRKLFVWGVVAFTLASLACGIASSQVMLLVARAAQGLAGAVVSAVALSLIMNLFPEGPGRVRAMGYFGFVMAGGGSVGVLLGGLLTGLFDWRSIFLVNLPIGVLVVVLAMRVLPKDAPPEGPMRLDIAGAATITLALLLAVYGVVGTEHAGWTSPQTIGLLAAASLLLAIFLWIEARVFSPLVPLRLFASRNVSTANVIGVLWAAAMFAWFFLSALYLQRVLGYGPMAVGLAFLPANLIMAAFSISLSAMLVNRFGFRRPLSGGLACAAAGLLLFALAPAEGDFWIHVLPPMLLLGIGAGMAFNPLLLSAMNDVAPEESGLASGVVNTAFMMGGALGLAVLASLAAGGTREALASGATDSEALTAGYRIAFLVGAACAAGASFLAAVLIRTPARAAEAQPVSAH
jgi:EmrB/QacA subfamily drug resistance transporter